MKAGLADRPNVSCPYLTVGPQTILLQQQSLHLGEKQTNIVGMSTVSKLQPFGAMHVHLEVLQVGN